MILVANPFQHIFHLANNRLGGHNLNLTTKAKYPTKELWTDSNRDFNFKMLTINFIDHHIRTKLVNHSVHHAMKEAKPDSFHLAIIHAKGVLAIVVKVDLFIKDLLPLPGIAFSALTPSILSMR